MNSTNSSLYEKKHSSFILPSPWPRKLLSLWLLCLPSLSSLNAQPVPLIRISLLPGYGWGQPTDIGGFGQTIQPYRYGIGLRLEHVLDSKVSLGALFMAYTGESVSITPSGGTPLTLQSRMWHTGFEVAYELGIRSGYVVRPHLGFGVGEPVGNFSAELAGTNGVGTVSATGVRPYVAFGVGTFVETGSIIFAGIDLRYMAISDYRNANSFAILGTIGFNITKNH